MTKKQPDFSDLIDGLEDDPGYGPDQFGALQLIDDLRQWRLTIEDATARAVHRARAEGRTWEDIGEVLGTTRQAAQQRYGDR